MGGHRLVEITIGHHVENRGEGLFGHDGHFGSGANQRRLDEEARPRKPLAAAEDFGPLNTSRFEGVLHPLGGRLVDERPHQHAFFPGIANPHAAKNRDELFEEPLGDRFVHEQPPQRRAPLARRAQSGKRDGPQGQPQVGRLRDDDAVVSAEFQQRPP